MVSNLGDIFGLVDGLTENYLLKITLVTLFEEVEEFTHLPMGGFYLSIANPRDKFAILDCNIWH